MVSGSRSDHTRTGHFERPAVVEAPHSSTIGFVDEPAAAVAESDGGDSRVGAERRGREIGELPILLRHEVHAGSEPGLPSNSRAAVAAPPTWRWYSPRLPDSTCHR